MKKYFLLMMIPLFFLGVGQAWAAVGPSGWTEGKLLMESFGLPNQSVWYILNNFVLALLAIFGIASIIAFVWAGFKYLGAGVDEDEAKDAKNAMKYSIYGIIVALMGFVVLQAITRMLNANPVF